MSAINYHLEELKIARTPGDPRHIRPALPDRFGSLLDLGCGIGQNLLDCALPPETLACGVDIDAEALAFGRRLAPQLCLVCARGERLPFQDHSFDVVMARVSLPFMHLPSALREVARVVKPGGYVWCTLHPWAMLRARLRDALRTLNLKDFVYSIYILINGLCFHLTGRQFRYPLNRQRCESFQTVGGMTRAMQRAGFEQVQTDYGRFFVVTASKRNPSSLLATKEDKLCVASAG